MKARKNNSFKHKEIIAYEFFLNEYKHPQWILTNLNGKWIISSYMCEYSFINNLECDMISKGNITIINLFIEDKNIEIKIFETLYKAIINLSKGENLNMYINKYYDYNNTNSIFDNFNKRILINLSNNKHFIVKNYKKISKLEYKVKLNSFLKMIINTNNEYIIVSYIDIIKLRKKRNPLFEIISEDELEIISNK